MTYLEDGEEISLRVTTKGDGILKDQSSVLQRKAGTSGRQELFVKTATLGLRGTRSRTSVLVI